MPVQQVNTGSAPNDGTGDPLRTAFTKLNQNDASLDTVANAALVSAWAGTAAAAAITGTNAGSAGDGVGVALGRAGDSLPFRRLKSPDGSITFVETGTNIQAFAASGTGTGEANTIGNSGAGADGVGLAGSKVGVQLQVKRLRSPNSTITFVETGSNIQAFGFAGTGEINTIGDAGAGADGAGLAAGKTGVQVLVKRIKSPNSTITVVETGTNVQLFAFSGTGEINTLGNSGVGGDGAGLAGTKVGTELQVKRLKSPDGSITIVETGTNIQVFGTSGSGGGEANTIGDAGSPADGQGLSAGKTGIQVLVKRLASGTNTVVSSTGSNAQVHVTAIETTSVAWTGPSVGETSGVASSGGTLILDLRQQAYQPVSINGDTHIAVSNPTPGYGVTARLTGDIVERNLTFQSEIRFLGVKPTSLAAGKIGVASFTSYGSTADTVMGVYAAEGVTSVSSGTGEVNTIGDAGSVADGAGLAAGKTGVQVLVKRIKSPNSTVSVVETGTNVQLFAWAGTGEVNTIGDAGAGADGAGLAAGKTGVQVLVKRIKSPDSSVTVVETGTNVQLFTTSGSGGEVNTIGNSGAGADGAGLAGSKVGVQLQVKRLSSPNSTITFVETGSNVQAFSFAGTGEVNTLGNSGAGADGAGLAGSKVGVQLQVKRLRSPNSTITFVETGSNVEAYAFAGTGIGSVALAVPTEFSVANTPITSSGTLTVSKVAQAPNRVYASPSSGTGVPTFRDLFDGDLPIVPINKGGLGRTTTGPTNSALFVQGGSYAAKLIVGSGILITYSDGTVLLTAQVGGFTFWGSGSPETRITGSPFNTYWDTQNKINYVKDSGTNTNTGWI